MGRDYYRCIHNVQRWYRWDLSAENEITVDVSIYSFNNSIIIDIAEIFGKEIVISVFDITGKIITTQTGTTGKIEIPVTVPEGIYIVEVTSEENKFVKKVYLWM
jgi:hypothetical protein